VAKQWSYHRTRSAVLRTTLTIILCVDTTTLWHRIASAVNQFDSFYRATALYAERAICYRPSVCPSVLG